MNPECAQVFEWCSDEAGVMILGFTWNLLQALSVHSDRRTDKKGI